MGSVARRSRLSKALRGKAEVTSPAFAEAPAWQSHGLPAYAPGYGAAGADNADTGVIPK
jgi:hypothetical protein